MANSNDIFRGYNRVIKLSNDDRDKLRGERDYLREKMKSNYRLIPSEEHGGHHLKFVSQGSYVMDTIITPKDGDFDLDDGVYFIGTLDQNSRPEPATIHDWVIRAIGEDRRYKEVKDKTSCVRVYYEDGFHIDLPIYYARSINDPDLADKKKGWHPSNPVEFIAWFESKIESGFNEDYIYKRDLLQEEFKSWAEDIRKRDVQLRRIVRYLKGWGDYKRGEMPPGIVMTILAGETYGGEIERDDIALRETLINSRDWLTRNGFRCPRPTTPKGEDLFADFSDDRKQDFMNALDSFIADADAAIRNPNPKQACLLWQKHFGPRFSCEQVRDEKVYSSLAAGASKSDMWAQ